MRTLFEIQEEIEAMEAAYPHPPNLPSEELKERFIALRRERCETLGHHAYSMIYNDGTTCLDCGYHRPASEESGFIRSVSGVEVPALLCDLARALPMSCDPSHEPRENPAICKACNESRDEIQQLVGDGDLNAIAIVIGVYLRRLYAEHERLGDAVRDYCATPIADNETKIWFWFYNLEGIFAEVLSDEERSVPADNEAVAMLEEIIGATRQQITDVINRRRRKK